MSRAIVLREFGEELIIADHDKQIIYKFETVAAGVDPEAQHLALDAWQRRFLNGNQQNYTELPVPVKWFKGPDQLIPDVSRGRLSIAFASHKFARSSIWPKVATR